MSSIGAVILAAGMSKRMNGAKLAMDLHHKPIIQYVVEAALHPLINRIVIVTGAYAAKIKQCIPTDPKIAYIHNEQYKKGMGTSLACGMKAMAGSVDATFVFLADQPCIPPHVIEKIGAHYFAHKHTNLRIVRPTFAGKEGHPILFTSSLFQAFFSLKNDIGGREIIEKNREFMHTIPFSNQRWGQDIDTQEQLNGWRRDSLRLFGEKKEGHEWMNIYH